MSASNFALHKGEVPAPANVVGGPEPQGSERPIHPPK